MYLHFSIIIAVYNRPRELRELLQSLQAQDFEASFEVVVVEDGSTESAEAIVASFQESLKISYYEKANSGPGDSRNYGVRHAQGNYCIFLDSDCILPKSYLTEVYKALQAEFVPFFGGPDAAAASFTDLQKAVNHVMTSFLTTGGIRGRKTAVGKFQPRSFNMGISKEVFEKVGGFGEIRYGEDQDLTFRVWKAGYASRLFPKAFVYHKRRISWGAFYEQVKKFGLVRPVLNQWHPGTARLVYWFPTLFTAGLIFSLLLALAGIVIPLGSYAVYFLLLFFEAWIKNKSLPVAVLTIFAAIVQFTGYGTGFLKATTLLSFSGESPKKLFPYLFSKVEKPRKKSANVFGQRTVKVFSLFLAGSFLAWFLSNLSESYEARATFTLTYKNVPDTLLLGNNTARDLEVKLRASGFQFLYYNFIRKSITLDVSQALYQNGNYAFPKTVLQRQVEQQLSQYVSLLAVDEKQLVIDLYQAISKKVPITADVDLSFRQNYILAAPLRVVPTHVTVKGPEREVDSLTAVLTSPLVLDALSSDFSREVALVFPKSLKNTTFSTSKATIAGKVIRFSEKVFSVPIQVVNAPEGYRVKTFPNTIPILCKASVDRLKALAVADFEIIADYQQLKDANTNTLFLEIAKEPGNVYDISLPERTVNFVLEPL